VQGRYDRREVAARFGYAAKKAAFLPRVRSRGRWQTHEDSFGDSNGFVVRLATLESEKPVHKSPRLINAPPAALFTEANAPQLCRLMGGFMKV